MGTKKLGLENLLAGMGFLFPSAFYQKKPPPYHSFEAAS